MKTSNSKKTGHAPDMSINRKEDAALQLLMEIVTKARNNLPYKEDLAELKSSLDEAPNIRRTVAECLRSRPDIAEEVS